MMIETKKLKLTYTHKGSLNRYLATDADPMNFGTLNVTNKETGCTHIRHGVLHRNPQDMLDHATKICNGLYLAVGDGYPPPEGDPQFPQKTGEEL